jgi:oxygen-independent coproporphyrinogen-3 oxidase
MSVYILEIHPQAEIDALRRRRPRLFPSDDEQSRRYRWLAERLDAVGLRRYEISNFARPGRESRHNLKYWRCQPVLGFGPSAHSLVDGRRWRNPPDLRRYLATPDETEAQPTDLDQESLFLGLRLARGVSRRRLEAVLRLTPDELETRVEALVPYVELLADRVRLTMDGVLLSTAVLAELLMVEPRHHDNSASGRGMPASAAG